jgi:ribonuclease HII
MAWIIGIDEAGYGPNLGPLVMTSVACRVPDHQLDADLWKLLSAVVRKAGKADGRLLVDDSKVVHSSTRGLEGLEQQVLALLWRSPRNGAACLGDVVNWVCADGVADLAAETWFTGLTSLPCEADGQAIAAGATAFDQCCSTTGVGPWLARSVVVPTPRFNALLDENESKGSVLAHGLGVLLRDNLARLDGNDPLCIAVDKHGGRNAYAALIQHALSDGVVLAQQEGMLRSSYRVEGLGREVRLTFQPRADSEHFTVALASMVSKYLREALMLEFNAFWLKQVPGLKPTAGYPLDAGRFFEAIRAAADRLGLAESALWRKK